MNGGKTQTGGNSSATPSVVKCTSNNSRKINSNNSDKGSLRNRVNDDVLGDGRVNKSNKDNENSWRTVDYKKKRKSNVILGTGSSFSTNLQMVNQRTPVKARKCSGVFLSRFSTNVNCDMIVEHVKKETDCQVVVKQVETKYNS